MEVKMKNGYHYYKIRIDENNGEDGLKLEDLERKLISYLEKKMKKSPKQPLVLEEGMCYLLRNGLMVILVPKQGTSYLEMSVVGNVDTFNKSVAAVSKIYPARFTVEYLV